MKERWRVIHGDALDVMPTLEPGSVDAIVTDPPYGLEFMGKDWDHGIPGVHFWQEALRVAKPGAHLVAFGGTRTHHRLMCAIEDAGWEIRDCLMWLYGSGFPKSHNGPWGGTALKPAWEPIILARKPIRGTVAANVTAHGTGAINVDGCRIEGPAWTFKQGPKTGRTGGGTMGESAPRSGLDESNTLGRWPANVVLDEAAGAMLDAQAGELTSGANPTRRGSPKFRHAYGEFVGQEECEPARGAESGGASRFFYCAKASRAEREAGLDGPESPMLWSAGTQNPGSFQSPNTHRAAKNHHPTVKPVALMRWLVRLVTPPGGTVLDPFAGSGSTGVACAHEGFAFLGIEKEAEYVAIAERRIAEAAAQGSLFGTEAAP